MSRKEETKERENEDRHELTFFAGGTGAVLGAVLGGPVGAAVGGAIGGGIGALLEENKHKK